MNDETRSLKNSMIPSRHRTLPQYCNFA